MSRPKIKGRGQSQSEIDHLARQTKELILPQVSFEGCDQDEGKLIFRPDGTGVFRCRTINWSARRGARWHTALAIRNVDGSTLFGIGPFFSPTAAPPICEWATHFDFPEAYFPRIAAAIPKYGCAVWVADHAVHSSIREQPILPVFSRPQAWESPVMAF